MANYIKHKGQQLLASGGYYYMLPHKTVQLGRGQGIDNKIIIHWLPLVVGCGHDGASVQQDLDDLVVVGVRGQDEGRDVRGEGGSVRRQCLPTLKI